MRNTEERQQKQLLISDLSIFINIYYIKVSALIYKWHRGRPFHSTWHMPYRAAQRTTAKPLAKGSQLLLILFLIFRFCFTFFCSPFENLFEFWQTNNGNWFQFCLTYSVYMQYIARIVQLKPVLNAIIWLQLSNKTRPSRKKSLKLLKSQSFGELTRSRRIGELFKKRETEQR